MVAFGSMCVVFASWCIPNVFKAFRRVAIVRVVANRFRFVPFCFVVFKVRCRAKGVLSAFLAQICNGGVVRLACRKRRFGRADFFHGIFHKSEQSAQIEGGKQGCIAHLVYGKVGNRGKKSVGRVSVRIFPHAAFFVVCERKHVAQFNIVQKFVRDNIARVAYQGIDCSSAQKRGDKFGFVAQNVGETQIAQSFQRAARFHKQKQAVVSGECFQHLADFGFAQSVHQFVVGTVVRGKRRGHNFGKFHVGKAACNAHAFVYYKVVERAFVQFCHSRFAHNFFGVAVLVFAAEHIYNGGNCRKFNLFQRALKSVFTVGIGFLAQKFHHGNIRNVAFQFDAERRFGVDVVGLAKLSDGVIFAVLTRHSEFGFV